LRAVNGQLRDFALRFSHLSGHHIAINVEGSSDKSSAALAFSAIGEVMTEKGDLAGAHEMYQQALAIQKEIG
jgi:hypothetical protein